MAAVPGTSVPPADRSTKPDTQLILDSMVTKKDLHDVFCSKEFSLGVINAMKPIINELTAEFKSVNTTSVQHDKRLTSLEATVKTQQEKIDKLTMQQNTTEKQERMKNIRVTGLQCPKEDTHCEIAHLIAEQLGITDIQLGDYTCRIIQPRAPGAVNNANFPPLNNTQGQEATLANSKVLPPQPLTVIVTFANIWRRREVYGSKRFLKNTNIFFSEDLPKSESYLLYECRQLRRQNIITACYSKDMNVYIKTHAGVEIPIKCQADLDSVKAQLTPLSTPQVQPDTSQAQPTQPSRADQPTHTASNPNLGRSLTSSTPQATSTPSTSQDENDLFHSTTSIHSSDLTSEDSEVTFEGFTQTQIKKAKKKAGRLNKKTSSVLNKPNQ